MTVPITSAPINPVPETTGPSDGPASETGRKTVRNAGPRGERTEYLAGAVIADRYKLIRPLGRGGMGVVWVAHSLALGVDVALKLIHTDLGDATSSTRMAREAHAAARLGHPAMVRVFDFGWTSRADPFLVMELVQGESLGSVLRRELHLPAIQAVQLLLPLADGLRSAHDKGIVHRDVKPDNILIGRDEFGRQQPKLLDFGIAKVDQTLTSEDRKLTQEGVALGSPEYMSPEQALGRADIDHRSDVWAFCVVLYESITGKMPFDRPNYNALMQAIIHDTALPTTELSAGDADLWRVIERGLQKNPENRWSSMTELGEALALWLYEHGVKEDISANSLRAVWLDGSLSGVRMDLSSTAPQRSSHSPAMDSGARVAQAAERLKATDRPSLLPQQSAVTVSRRSVVGQARRWVWAAGMGAALVLVLGTDMLFRGARAATPPPVNSAISAPPAAATAVPTAIEQASSPASAATVSTAAAPSSHPTPGHAATRAVASPARTAPSARPLSHGKRYDYGF
ncbi:MAG TPA: serine/threonine-protein kinase [Polyangiaceae bacterium]|jgi:serine/threonine protein kinase|nr:serine/threonine-protein kinase [Polyangiaceae bacterium]